METETLYQKLCSKVFLISGPCVIENEDNVFEIAEAVQKIAERLNMTYVFKASFDKANRTSVEAYRGPGIEKGLRILEKVKQRFGLPVTTDIHETWHAKAVAEVVDIIQIPAFLARQTDLLLASGETGRIVNVKKAQFLTGRDMVNVVRKLEHTQNKQIMLTERGTSFGNNNLVVDFRNVVDMLAFGYPLVMDVTHSVQKPGGDGTKSSGDNRYAPYLAQAAAAVGVRGFFFETHPDPSKALSDGPNMIPLDKLESVLRNTLKHCI